MFKKKTISIFSIVAVLLISCMFILSGCSDLSSNKVHANISSIMEQAVYSENSFITIDYQLKEFNYYQDDGSLIEGDKNYQQLTLIGLDYLNLNYKNFYDEKDKLSFNYEYVNNKLNELKSSYDEAQENYENLLTVKDIDDKLLYNGFFVKYQSACKDFIEKLYSFNLTMIDVFENNLNLYDYDFSILIDTQANDYVDKIIFEIANDCKEVLLDSFKGERFDGVDKNYADNNIYQSASDYLVQLNAISHVYDISDRIEEFAILETINTKLTQEREMFEISLKDFSFYDILENNYTIEQYEKYNENAKEDLQFIEKYFLQSSLSESTNKCVVENVISLLQDLFN